MWDAGLQPYLDLICFLVWSQSISRRFRRGGVGAPQRPRGRTGIVVIERMSSVRRYRQLLDWTTNTHRTQEADHCRSCETSKRLIDHLIPL